MGKFLFEIPIENIKKLDVIIERSSSPLWPNESINIDIDLKYFKSNIEPIIKNESDLNLIKLLKVKSVNDGVYKLKGYNKTIFNDEIFKMKYSKTLKEE